MEVAGVSMIERIWRIANSVSNANRVIVTTEDQRIVEHVASFGGQAVLTSDACKNGTERVWETTSVANVTDEIIVNLQGDAVLTPPWILEKMISEIENDSSIDIVTPALKLSPEQLKAFSKHKQTNPASGTTVVFNQRGNALYFSKNIIPFTRSEGHSATYRHIGLYGFRKTSLEKYIALDQTALELTEGLEQLRALENGMTIRVIVADYRGRTHGSIDSPEDVSLVEKIIQEEGELV